MSTSLQLNNVQDSVPSLNSFEKKLKRFGETNENHNIVHVGRLVCVDVCAVCIAKINLTSASIWKADGISANLLFCLYNLAFVKYIREPPFPLSFNNEATF